jgi:glycosyltransferase involved in cell wall biosynthesis
MRSDTKIDRYYFNESIVRFFEAGDEEDLARSMLSLISDRDARERLINNARQYIQGLTWETKKSEYFELVDGMTKNDVKISH